MNQKINKIERPVLIRLICILGFIGIGLTTYWVLTAPEDMYEKWYLFWLAGSIILMFAALLGIWRMRKWGANLYTVVAIVNVASLVLTKKEFLFDLILTAAIIFVLLSNYSKMK